MLIDKALICINGKDYTPWHKYIHTRVVPADWLVKEVEDGWSVCRIMVENAYEQLGRRQMGKGFYRV